MIDRSITYTAENLPSNITVVSTMIIKASVRTSIYSHHLVFRGLLVDVLNSQCPRYLIFNVGSGIFAIGCFIYVFGGEFLG